MRAAVKVGIAGIETFNPGDVVEGALAEELVSVGLATPLEEAPLERTAEADPAKEPGAKVRKAKKD
ncbi:hypothetical protein [Brevundimonas sp.]|uniref:hypothetical protein n=1 Tax=Brevundimonas sp. TaxID=1871086 RepID=UPI0035B3C701